MTRNGLVRGPLIDVVGLPASGKSSLGKRLAADLELEYRVLWPAHDPDGRGMTRWQWRRQALWLVPRHRRIFMLGLSGWRSTRQRAMLRSAAQAAFRAEALRMHSRAVTDEGPLQAVAIALALARGLDLEREARAYSQALPRVDLTIRVDCDLEVVKARRLERNGPRSRRWDGLDVVYENSERYSLVLDNLLTGPVLRVDTTAAPLGELVPAVVEAVSSRLGSLTPERR